MGNSHLIKFLLGKQSFYNIFSNDSYMTTIFAWLSLNPDYTSDKNKTKKSIRPQERARGQKC